MTATSAFFVALLGLGIISIVLAIYVPKRHQILSAETKVYRALEDGRPLISDQTFDEAMTKLFEYVKGERPSMLVGVNHGGVHIAARIAEQLGLKQDMVYRLISDVASGEETKNDKLRLLVREGEPAPDFNNESVVFIDDIVRSGGTIRQIRAEYETHRKLNNRLKFAVLFCSKGSAKYVDFFANEIDNSKVCFKWSPIEKLDFDNETGEVLLYKRAA